MARDIKKEMMELLGGEFLDWYSNLNDEEKQQYNIEFNKLQDNDIPHSDIRRMESEGVYEEKFSEKIPQWTQSHTGAAEHGVFFNDEWNKSHNEVEQSISDESHALDMVMNDMVKDMDIQDFEDNDAYEDGVDERPIKKDVEYNDDEFDY
jgi:hypothetical protein